MADIDGSARECPVVTLADGLVRGRWADGVADFRGIPYGDRVDGPSRFRAPRKPQPWTGVRDCRLPGRRAIQKFGNLFQTRTGEYFTGGRIGELSLNEERDSENCLVLNVLTPDPSPASRPVMVYLHGGGFAEGSGVLATAAHRLASEHDVVVVSANHRLNVFGYLYLAELDPRFADSGTAGLLDLVLALEWVRDNIAAFGGDPKNVTIFGESGGGAKVSSLLAMPAAAGLFRRAIIESGSIMRAVEPHEATEAATALLARLQIGPDELLDLPANVLFAAAEPDAWRFRPVVDGRNLTRHPFDPDAPPTAAGIPLIVGHCADEMDGLWGEIEGIFDLDEGQLVDQLRRVLALDDAQIDRVRSTYAGILAAPTPSSIFLRATSDAFFGEQATRQAERQLATGAQVYRYRFDYKTHVEGGRYGAFHTAELPLVFRLVYEQQAEQLSQRLAAAWAAFATTGDPSTPALRWDRYDLDRRATMVFDVQSQQEDDPGRAERLLWQEVEPVELFGAPLPLA